MIKITSIQEATWRYKETGKYTTLHEMHEIYCFMREGNFAIIISTVLANRGRGMAFSIP